jgi:hypothetical protein
MLFHRINRTNPEKVYVICKNSYSTADLSAGQVVSWDYVTDKDGISVTKPSGILLNAPAGVAIAAIASGDYGLLQVWGHNAAVRMSGGSGYGTSKVTAGSPLFLKTSGFALFAQATVASNATITVLNLQGACAIAAGPTTTAAKATSATTWTGTAFIKCL